MVADEQWLGSRKTCGIEFECNDVITFWFTNMYVSVICLITILSDNSGVNLIGDGNFCCR